MITFGLINLSQKLTYSHGKLIRFPAENVRENLNLKFTNDPFLINFITFGIFFERNILSSYIRMDHSCRLDYFVCFLYQIIVMTITPAPIAPTMIISSIPLPIGGIFPKASRPISNVSVAKFV